MSAVRSFAAISKWGANARPDLHLFAIRNPRVYNLPSTSSPNLSHRFEHPSPDASQLLFLVHSKVGVVAKFGLEQGWLVQVLSCAI